jgi:hypothetical protein
MEMKPALVLLLDSRPKEGLILLESILLFSSVGLGSLDPFSGNSFPWKTFSMKQATETCRPHSTCGSRLLGILEGVGFVLLQQFQSPAAVLDPAHT